MPLFKGNSRGNFNNLVHINNILNNCRQNTVALHKFSKVVWVSIRNSILKAKLRGCNLTVCTLGPAHLLKEAGGPSLPLRSSLHQTGKANKHLSSNGPILS